MNNPPSDNTHQHGKNAHEYFKTKNPSKGIVSLDRKTSKSDSHIVARLREEIKAILTKNAGRIPERLEHDLDLIEALFTAHQKALLERVLGESPKKLPDSFHINDLIGVQSRDNWYRIGYNKALGEVEAVIRGMMK